MIGQTDEKLMRATDCGNPGSLISLCNFMENVAGKHKVMVGATATSTAEESFRLLYSFVAIYIITT